MRVLLVDDDREVAEYVRRELEEESFNVVVAQDGASALRLAEKSVFDIIVLDVMMPFMDGLQVTRSLRRQNIMTPILLLTGRDAPEEIVGGLHRHGRQHSGAVDGGRQRSGDCSDGHGCGDSERGSAVDLRSVLACG